ncbi:hypothetical protein D3C72_2230790 [compost metagenome]
MHQETDYFTGLYGTYGQGFTPGTIGSLLQRFGVAGDEVELVVAYPQGTAVGFFLRRAEGN